MSTIPQRGLGRATRIGTCAIGLGLLAGCAQNGTMAQRQAAACGGFGAGNKQDLGTALGAVGVGLATGLLTHNWAAGLGGAAVGGLVGNRIGAALDADDCRALIAQSAMALREAQDGAPVGWTSAKTGAQASIVPSNTRIISRAVSISLDSDVTPVPGLEPIGSIYAVRRAAPVHLAADEASPLAGAGPLEAGSHVRVVGRVPDAPWLLVARQGSAIGYVAQSNLTASNLAATGPAATHHPRHAPARAAQTAPADLDSLKTAQAVPQPSPYDLNADAPLRPVDLDAAASPSAPAPGAAFKTQTLTASVQCRDLATTMTLKGQSETSRTTACRSPDGAWELDDSQAKHS